MTLHTSISTAVVRAAYAAADRFHWAIDTACDCEACKCENKTQPSRDKSSSNPCEYTRDASRRDGRFSVKIEKNFLQLSPESNRWSTDFERFSLFGI